MTAALAVANTASQHARRDRLLASAQQLLEERDYEQIQVREVAEDAGVALGTLYRYFPSKELLYAHALLTWSESFEAKVRSLDKADNSDADRLRAALHGAVRAYERAPRFFRLLTLLEVAADPAVRSVFATFSDRFLSLLRGVLRDIDDATAADIAYVSGSVLGSSLRSWANEGTSVRLVHQRLDVAVDLLLIRCGRP